MSFFVAAHSGRMTQGLVVADLVGPYLIITNVLV